MKTLKIYFTSDIHGYVYPTDYLDQTDKNIGLLNCMNQFKKDGNTLIIDGGDTIQGSPLTNYLSSNPETIHPIATIMNTAGYDYVTFGNHEFNYGYDYLASYIQHLEGKCICANIIDKTNQLKILPFDVKTMENGLKVGILGFTTDFITRWERESNLENFLIEDVYQSVNKYFDLVRNQCDFLIGVYHGGFEYDLTTEEKLSDTRENIAYELCSTFEFDLLLTGHQHMPLAGQYVHGTYIAQTPHNGTKFLELQVEINEDTKENLISSSLKEASLPPEKTMFERFLSLEEKVQDWLDTPVGHLSQPLEPSSHLDMASKGSTLANFINQIQLEESGAQIACTSFANSIKGFDANVTVRDIMSTYVYPNTLVVLAVSGAVLKLALERCASYFELKNHELAISDRFLKPKVEHYNYDYFSNIEYTFDLRKEVGQRVLRVEYEGKEVKDSDTFTLVMNNYRGSGAGGYEFFCDCEIVKEIPTEMPEIIINYFKRHSYVQVDTSSYISVIL